MKTLLRSVTSLFLVISFALMLSGCGVVNALKMRMANNGVEPVWPEGAVNVQLPTAYVSDKPYVRAMVNGQHEMLFLVDTGASITLLNDSEKVRSLKLEKGFDLPLSGWGEGKDSSGFQTELNSLSIGGIEFKNFKVAYLPVSQTDYYLSEDEIVYDGVIGHDVLRHFVWTFNRNTQTTTVANRPYQPSASEQKIEMDVFFAKPYIPVNVEFKPGHLVEHEVIIDTGSRHYFKLSSAYLEDNNIEPEITVEAADFGLSGAALHQRFTANHISLGNNQFNKVKVNVIKSDDDDDWWVIGNALLSKQVFTLDYIEEAMYIEGRKETAVASRFNKLGLELRKTKVGDFIVRFIFPNLSAEKSGLKVGDRIVEIDGLEASELSEEQWLDITDTNGAHRICTEARCWNLEAKGVEGYSQFSAE